VVPVYSDYTYYISDITGTQYKYLPSSVGCLPSLEAWSLHCRHFKDFAWGIIDGDLGWGFVFHGLSANDFVIFCDFLIGRKGL
jgi:hypothetical protein